MRAETRCEVDNLWKPCAISKPSPEEAPRLERLDHRHGALEAGVEVWRAESGGLLAGSWPGEAGEGNDECARCGCCRFRGGFSCSHDGLRLIKLTSDGGARNQLGSNGGPDGISLAGILFPSLFPA